MKWSEFAGKPSNIEAISSKYADTNIECPICGEFIKRRTDIILTSCPPKHEYRCLRCKWIGTA